jgi:NhaA family Na+:H+ antiporter
MAAPRTGVWAFVLDNSLLLVAGTVTALIWANTADASYSRFSHALQFPVNGVGMVFFFALAMTEILEARLPGGSLASTSGAAVPLFAALGGMAAPAGLYVAQALAVGRPDLMRGWAIPCATDVAFSYLAARLIFPKGHPAIPFLLLLAIADDALGLIVLALFYPSAPLSIVSFVGLMIPALVVAAWLKRRRTISYWPYVIVAGGLSWAALFVGGLHPALALVPIVPFMAHRIRRSEGSDPHGHDLLTMNRFERAWRIPVQVILLLFGLVNAGVTFASVGPGSWIVLSSLIVGKPLGIAAATFLASQVGLRASVGLTYLEILTIGVAAGVGFTVALFFATAAFPPGAVLDEAKMGALMSLCAAPLAIGIGRLVGLSPSRPRT